MIDAAETPDIRELPASTAWEEVSSAAGKATASVEAKPSSAPARRVAFRWLVLNSAWSPGYCPDCRAANRPDRLDTQGKFGRHPLHLASGHLAPARALLCLAYRRGSLPAHCLPKSWWPVRRVRDMHFGWKPPCYQNRQVPLPPCRLLQGNPEGRSCKGF